MFLRGGSCFSVQIHQNQNTMSLRGIECLSRLCIHHERMCFHPISPEIGGFHQGRLKEVTWPIYPTSGCGNCEVLGLFVGGHFGRGNDGWWGGRRGSGRNHQRLGEKTCSALLLKGVLYLEDDFRPTSWTTFSLWDDPPRIDGNRGRIHIPECVCSISTSTSTIWYYLCIYDIIYIYIHIHDIK